MRHKSYQTTQKHYINPTSQMQDAVSQMPLPGALQKETKPKENRAESATDPESPRTES